jgi:asparagine synthase (glutamine-hydrolysing)
MPGLIGITGKVDRDCGARLLADMAQAVKHEEWYRVDLHSEHECSMGRLTLGLLNDTPQPAWNEDQTLCVIMEGELYDHADLKQTLLEQGHCFDVNNDAELLLHLYEELGEEFALQLNGSFIAALWDRRAKKLLIATDRMGSHPLYYAHYHGKFSFAPNVHGLLVDPDLPRTVDRVAIAQAFTFDHILDDRTWLTNVHLMPPASILVYQENNLVIRSYWTMKYAESYPLQSEEDYYEGFLHSLRRAVKRQTRSCLPAGMMLSGGLDSRMLAAVIRDGPLVEPLSTFTWGIPGCDDARYAKDVAREIGADYHFFELKPDYLLSHAVKGVRLTNGSNCVHYHALASVSQATQFAKVIFKGVMGDAMMGTALTRHFWADYDSETKANVHFQTHYDRGVLLFTPQEQELLFTAPFQQQINGAVMDAYRAGMLASQSSQLADQRIYFDLRQRIPRMTWNGVELVRSQAVVRTPYSDNDVVEFALRLPPGFRFERYLVKRVLTEKYVELAQIPYTETGLPLRPCARDVLIRSQRLLAWHLNRYGLRATPDIPKRPYANYALWFRTTLREWVRDILLHKRALDRGYFNPAQVQRLFAEQMAGADHTVKLGALLSLELWHRQFLD